MIATILQSSPTFNAVLYNEKKVRQGSAVLLEMKNFGNLQILGYNKPQELQDYLIEYSDRNSRVKNAQFHLAISCKGNEWSHEELLEFAHAYLDEMGYGDPEQPLLVYAHHDTDNNHIHIVSSRVAPNGKKINDSKERIRSQKALEKLLKLNVKKQVDKDIEAAMQFEFTDMRQFKSVIEAMNYQCYESGDKLTGTLNIKKGGRVLAKIQKTDITRRTAENSLNKNKDDWQKQRLKIKALLHKYHDMNTDKVGLEQMLHKKLGLSLVWFGPKDNPFGYQVVDLANKKVYDGNSLFYVKQLLDFQTQQSKEEEIRNVIHSLLDKNPFTNTEEINGVLRGYGAYTKKGYFGWGKNKFFLDKDVYATIRRNDVIKWGRSFKPASEKEVELVCQLTKLPFPEFFPIVEQSEGRYKPDDTAKLFEILTATYISSEAKKEAVKRAGYSFTKTENGIFFVNYEMFKRAIIIDIERTGWPESLYIDVIPHKSEYQKGHKSHKSQSLSQSTNNKLLKDRIVGGKSANREWEVGKKETDRDDPDRNNQYSY